MYSLEKIQKLMYNHKDLTVRQFIAATNYGTVETVGAIF